MPEGKPPERYRIGRPAGGVSVTDGRCFVGGIIPPADEAALREAGVARVYTSKDFEVSRIMGDLVDLVAEHHGVASVS